VSLLRYAMIVLAATSLSGAAVLALVEASSRTAIGMGAALATLNTIAAFALAAWAERRPIKAFMVAVLGGMLARMAVLLAAVVVGVLWLRLPTAPLTLSLLGYFVAYLIFELAVLHHRTRARAPVS
jgi:hypothetical protein